MIPFAIVAQDFWYHPLLTTVATGFSNTIRTIAEYCTTRRPIPILAFIARKSTVNSHITVTTDSTPGGSTGTY